ncbi:hypothetical protein HZA45_00990 [Candidatus Peregrinibacteria bacterium]|nr:hypothetical protein [Candidatus Peregrinibacteria bacterium]
MLTPKDTNEHDPLLFSEKYRDAWFMAGLPDVHVVTEVFLAALEGVQPSDTDLRPLYEFMQAEIQNDVPLNWFKMYFHPGTNEPTNLDRTLFGSGPESPFASVIQRLLTQPGVEIRGIQIHSGTEIGIDDQETKTAVETRMDALSDDYYRAFIHAGCPDRTTMEDTILSAIGKDPEPPYPLAAALWTFVREHQKEALVKWFLGYADRFENIRTHPKSWACFLEGGDAGTEALS